MGSGVGLPPVASGCMSLGSLLGFSEPPLTSGELAMGLQLL